MVGQIAKLKGARAVGIAGGADKCRYVIDELGFDACVDHRAADFAAQLKAACPKGIDVYFENVGGAVFEAVFPLLNTFARMPVCGLIAHYNATELPPGELRTSAADARDPDQAADHPRLHRVRFRRAACRFPARRAAWLARAASNIARTWSTASRRRRALHRPAQGKNFGKLLVRVAE